MQAAVIPITPAIQLKNILFATDFSEASIAALPLVGSIVRRYNAQLTIAHFWTPSPLTMTAPESAPVIIEAAEQVAVHSMARLRRSFELNGLDPNIVLAPGDPSASVLLLASAHHADLIVIGTHGRTGLKRLVLGSVAESIFRQAACPVLTVGPHSGGHFRSPVVVRSILLPTDLSPESARVAPYVASLAAEYGARVSVLHVIPPEGRSNPAAQELLEPLRRQMQHMFGELISPAVKTDFLLRYGGEAESIVAEARDCSADLIAMALRPGYGLGAELQTTTAYGVIAKAECPVLTVRGR